MDWFIRHSAALASLAYASRMKRVGHGYYVNVIAATWNRSDEAKVVFGGAMPSFVTLRAPSTRGGSTAETRGLAVE